MAIFTLQNLNPSTDIPVHLVKIFKSHQELDNKILNGFVYFRKL